MRPQCRRLHPHGEGRTAHGHLLRPWRPSALIERSRLYDRRRGGRRGERRAGLLRVPGAAVQALPHREGQLPATLVSQTDRFLQPEKLGSRSALAHARRRVLVGRASCEGRPAAQGARVPNALYRHLAVRRPLAVHDHPYDRAAVRRVVHEGRHVRDGAGYGPAVPRARRRAAHVHAGGAHRGGERLRLRRRGGRRGALRRLRGVRRRLPVRHHPARRRGRRARQVHAAEDRGDGVLLLVLHPVPGPGQALSLRCGAFHPLRLRLRAQHRRHLRRRALSRRSVVLLLRAFVAGPLACA